MKGDDSLDELLMERFALAEERIAEICTEKEIKEPFEEFFREQQSFLKNGEDSEKRTGKTFPGRAEGGKYCVV